MLNMERIKKTLDELVIATNKANENTTFEFDDLNPMYRAFWEGYYDGRCNLPKMVYFQKWQHLQKMYEIGYIEGLDDRRIETEMENI